MLEGKDPAPLFRQWFRSKPDPDSVLNLLVARGNLGENDPFNLEAARYLGRMELSALPEKLQSLSVHPEPLARAFAYANLDAQKQGDAELLKNMLSLEPTNNLREFISGKLDSVEEMNRLSD
jgi:hypothetical protein